MMTRWVNPLATMNELRREVDRLFEDLGPRFGRGVFAPVRTFPALNVWEDGDSLYAEAELPGVSSEDVEVYSAGNELTIKGRREPRQGDQLSYHRRERGTGEFSRVITLPVEVDAEKVRADLRNGVLTITMPKAEGHKPKKITVKTD